MNINCRGNLLDLSTPKIMAILNLTPDSFYDGKTNWDEASIRSTIDNIMIDVPDIIDIGGMSSRPGAEIIDPQEEWNRIEPAIEYLVQAYPNQIISVDTIHSSVAKNALELGTHIINDISAGKLDENMMSTVANFNAPYVMMHMRNTPDSMQNQTQYEKGLAVEIMQYFKERINEARSFGIHDIILDLGFGFSKMINQNFQLLNMLHTFKIFDMPILTGLSRKSMIYKTIGKDAAQALNGTTALHMKALLEGSAILRVHDVVEARETIQLFSALKANK